jgi:cell division septum initiation protein DivIVA
MENWVGIFVAIAAIALALQALMQLAIGVFLLAQAKRIQNMIEEPRARINALLASVQTIVANTQPQVNKIIGDAAHVTELAREQAQRVDNLATDVVDRLRAQVVQTDKMLTATLESIQDAGSQLRRSILKPVQSVRALKHGLQVGLEVYRAGNNRQANGTEQYIEY